MSKIISATFVLLILFINGILGAVIHGCRDEKGNFWSVGEEKRLDGECEPKKCSDKLELSKTRCPIGFSRECSPDLTPEDPSKPFPDCCARQICDKA